MAHGSNGKSPERRKALWMIVGVAPWSMAFFHVIGKNDLVIETLEFRIPEETQIWL